MTIAMWGAEEALKKIDDEEFVLLDFKSATCPRCGPQVNVLERIVADYEGRVEFGIVDVEANPSLVEKFDVGALPTILLFFKGELKDTLRGFNKAPIVTMALDKVVAGN